MMKKYKTLVTYALVETVAATIGGTLVALTAVAIAWGAYGSVNVAYYNQCVGNFRCRYSLTRYVAGACYFS